ncbi:hypothetical protein [uncultured Clostridium sp.]|uniref:hypothetical protein n=1 Tax=uncultured Clostridium sp. TaxID=59620 RepID=UPI0034544687
MREHIDNTVNKSLTCSDSKYGFAEYICQNAEILQRCHLHVRVSFVIGVEGYIQ